MSHQVVYRKYRSRDFGELVGQEYIASTISNQIRQDSVGHAYLFFGPRGTGKTSTARIFAKTVNCENPVDTDGYLLPCEKCSSCINFTPDDMDILEMDAASNRGIDDARLLRERVSSQPMSHKYKFIILDEAHMLTREAVNALLKVIEEPPEYAIFVFCTTEFHKIPITISSRCQRFKFLLAKDEDLIKKLTYICESEEKKVSAEDLHSIAKLAKGSFRDAESLLEQMLFSDDHSYIQDLLSLYNDSNLVEKFITCVKDGSAEEFWQLLCNIETAQGDAKQLCEAVLDHAQEQFQNKKIEFDLMRKIIVLNGSIRGFTKEEIFYKYTKLLSPEITDSVSSSAPSSVQSPVTSRSNTVLSSVASSAIPVTPKVAIKVENEQEIPNLFREKPSIYNILQKSKIEWVGKNIKISVNSTISKMFLQKSNLLPILRESFPDIGQVEYDVVKSGSETTTSGPSDSSGNTVKQEKKTDLSKAEEIFGSRFI